MGTKIWRFLNSIVSKYSPNNDEKGSPLSARLSDADSFLSTIKHDAVALQRVVHLLGKQLQYEFASKILFYRKAEGNIPHIGSIRETLFWDIFKILPCGKNTHEILWENSELIAFKLNELSIIASPWNDQRFKRAISCIGVPGRGEKWKFGITPSDTPDLEVWHPLNICWVITGNHSLTAGSTIDAAGAKGTLLDFSAVYKHIDIDISSSAYITIQDGKVLSEVSNVYAATIFMAGKRLATPTC